MHQETLQDIIGAMNPCKSLNILGQRIKCIRFVERDKLKVFQDKKHSCVQERTSSNDDKRAIKTLGNKVQIQQKLFDYVLFNRILSTSDNNFMNFFVLYKVKQEITIYKI